jgi:3-deoxy-D-manno-octulosonic acid kinase
MARRLSNDEFLWIGLHRTRALREWVLLEHMYRAALPVPRPVAARVERHGAVYTADLITVRIPDVTTLSERLADTVQSTEVWNAVGQLIARFHAAGICHADLNVHNIQIDSSDRLYLLDFDRGRAMESPGGWMQRNLDRLHRSLTKLLTQGVIHFSESDWKKLLDGYRSALTAAAQSKS